MPGNLVARGTYAFLSWPSEVLTRSKVTTTFGPTMPCMNASISHWRRARENVHARAMGRHLSLAERRRTGLRRWYVRSSRHLGPCHSLCAVRSEPQSKVFTLYALVSMPYVDQPEHHISHIVKQQAHSPQASIARDSRLEPGASERGGYIYSSVIRTLLDATTVMVTQ